MTELRVGSPIDRIPPVAIDALFTLLFLWVFWEPGSAEPPRSKS
jgi:hypothetical protein